MVMSIVTIDFDIIMEPSIELYNDKIDNYTSISSLEKDFPFIKNIPANLYIYEYLTRFIISCIKKKIPITFIDKHDEMYNYIVDEYLPGEDLTIYNIDHHHDITYNNDELDAKEITLDVGNWVLALYKNKDYNISKYIWIHDENAVSDIQTEPKKQQYLTKEMKLKFLNLDEINVDRLFICRSFNWIPSQYRPLFMVWETIAEKLSN